MKRVLLTLLMSVFVTYIQAQDRTVSGKVTDETGQPLLTAFALPTEPLLLPPRAVKKGHPASGLAALYNRFERTPTGFF